MSTSIDLIVHSGQPATKSLRKPEFIEKLGSFGLDASPRMYQAASGTESAKTKGLRSPASASYVVKTSALEAEINPWDLAHLTNRAIPNENSFVEPDVVQTFVAESKLRTTLKSLRPENLAGKDEDLDFDPDWMPQQNLIWHLGSGFSQLQDARNAVLMPVNPADRVRIGHLDTGFDPDHPTKPTGLDVTRSKSFIDNETSAVDPQKSGLLKQPGHGTATLALLAGAQHQTADGAFNDFLGGFPGAHVVECRIASSVVLLKSSAFAEALHYLTGLAAQGHPVQVASMSMGGAATRSWADAVNRAYEAGITVVTAAGNNFNGLPTRHVVYPARFQRVIAACGVTYDGAPYVHDKLGEMQGNYGPRKVMKYALAAYTPNTPWARIGTNLVGFAGAGTSSATPQIAAAAALYYQKHKQALDALPGWQRVEAVRKALFDSARKAVQHADEEFSYYFGNGIVQARAALDVPLTTTGLTKLPDDRVPFFPVLTVLFKSLRNRPANAQEHEMFNVEMVQLVQRYPDLQTLLADEEKTFLELTPRQRKRFLDAVLGLPDASRTLKTFIKESYTQLSSTPAR